MKSFFIIGILLLLFAGYMSFKTSRPADKPTANILARPSPTISTPTNSTGAMFRANLQRTGVYDNAGVSEFTGLKWKFKTDGEIRSSPIVVNGTVYFGSMDKYFYAVNSETGEEVWRFSAESKIRSSPAMANGVVYFGSHGGWLYAINGETGDEEWRFKAEDVIISSPVVAEGIVYFGSFDTYLYAIDYMTGRQKWKFRLC